MNDQAKLTEDEWTPIFYALFPGDNGDDTRAYVERIIADRCHAAWEQGWEAHHAGSLGPNPYPKDPS